MDLPDMDVFDGLAHEVRRKNGPKNYFKRFCKNFPISQLVNLFYPYPVRGCGKAWIVSQGTWGTRWGTL